MNNKQGKDPYTLWLDKKNKKKLKDCLDIINALDKEDMLILEQLQLMQESVDTINMIIIESYKGELLDLK